MSLLVSQKIYVCNLLQKSQIIKYVIRNKVGALWSYAKMFLLLRNASNPILSEPRKTSEIEFVMQLFR